MLAIGKCRCTCDESVTFSYIVLYGRMKYATIYLNSGPIGRTGS